MDSQLVSEYEVILESESEPTSDGEDGLPETNLETGMYDRYGSINGH